MLKSLNSSRKKIQSRLSSLSSSSCSSSENVVLHSSSSEPARDSRAASVEAFVHQSCGGYKLQSESSPRVTWSSAGYQSRCPFGDINVFQADKQHILAAVISCSPTAQGGRYLQRHLHRELQHQLKQNGGNAQAALPATLRALDDAFRDMHPFNGHVCEGVKLTVAYIDAKSNMLHAASNGGCRLVIGRRLPGGGMYVVLDLGRTDRKQSGSSSNGAEPQAQSSATSTVKAPSGSSGTPKAAQRQQQRQDPLAEVEFASVQLREGIDTVILGSVGLWHELPSDKALLRLRHYYDTAPEANAGNAAMHLANFALHAVATRSARLQDPRMRSLRSVGHLQSLYTGDRSLYRWGKRQPVRRRRGDVHGDLSAIVLHIDWAGSADVSQHSIGKASRRAHAALHAMLPLQRASSAASLAVSERAHKRWDLLRMHFLEYPLHSKRLSCQKWHTLVESALEQSRELRHRRQAAEMLLSKGLLSDGALYRSASPQPVSPPHPRSASGGWQPAGRSHSSSPGSPGTADSLRSLLKQGLSASREQSESSGRGQPLVPDSRNTSLAGASSLVLSPLPSLGSPAEHRDRQPVPAAVPRTLSRRNLLVPAQTPSLPVVMERGESQALSETVKALHDIHMDSPFGQAGQPDARSQDWQEWLAYQNHLERKSLQGHNSTVRAF